jgi:hypothetical protein
MLSSNAGSSSTTMIFAMLDDVNAQQVYQSVRELPRAGSRLLLIRSSSAKKAEIHAPESQRKPGVVQ